MFLRVINIYEKYEIHVFRNNRLWSQKKLKLEEERESEINKLLLFSMKNSISKRRRKELVYFFFFSIFISIKNNFLYVHIFSVQGRYNTRLKIKSQDQRYRVKYANLTASYLKYTKTKASFYYLLLFLFPYTIRHLLSSREPKKIEINIAKCSYDFRKCVKFQRNCTRKEINFYACRFV